MAGLPHRSGTVKTTTTMGSSDDEVIGDSDLGGTTSILVERLRAWKHMVGYLENYVSATQKVQKAQSKEFEKILKTVSEPLREAHHFVQGEGGVAGLFESLRVNTRGIADMYLETEKSLKSTVLPILEKLHGEIKAKSKELHNGATKAAKQVAKARTTTQKHIELLGQYTAAFDSATKSKQEALNDPYILSRGVVYRLNKQITEENNNLKELLAIQNSFQQFEAHILETVQDALNRFFQCMGAQSDRQRAMYADMVSTGQQIPTDFEWANFFEKNDASLINPNTPPRSMSNITFPNQEHRSTKPLVEGTIQRKSRAVMKGYSDGYYVVTPAGFLHGFKDNDDLRHDPQPDISLYLPDCTIGNFDGLKFSVKGKDVSGGKVGNAFHMTSELHFKTHSKNQIDEWASALSSFVGSSSAGGSQPTSPTVQRSASAPRSPTATESAVMPPLAESKPVDEKADPAAAPAQKQEDGIVAVDKGEKSA
ncbi:PH domain-containing protein [Coccidioides immitis RS]|uniref:PH domain-containing protein n=3 Tax=Coccidioides immitis TaxID=5501 RepID=J3KIS2_COCIM|nr:PH domain-containing protein [Coccidioides immitis RS]EAS35892.3 PH domain-containing protein [Coccidioides immitis RS]KMP01181.1 cytoplasm protein [Coccidioides immitis RMSCC 2394]KMU83689.1 cytoplasm protein [Coccidioides immitis H538.4]TPX25915.1 hypothetical protein DIZ76_011372 [Coccidioides immitis]